MSPKQNPVQRATALSSGIRINPSDLHPDSVIARCTQVEAQNSEIANALDRLQRVTESLQSRLASVTAAYPACDDAKCAPPDACLVPLAEALRSHSRRINAIGAQIEALLANIEL